MDHDHGSGGMGGMDMPPNSFQSTNMKLARAYWYIIAGVVGLLLAIRIIDFCQNWLRWVDPQIKKIRKRLTRACLFSHS